MLKEENINKMVDISREITRELNQKVETKEKELREIAWKSDITPEAYYTQNIRRLAEDKINYQEKLNRLEQLEEDIINIQGRITLEKIIKDSLDGLYKYNEKNRDLDEEYIIRKFAKKLDLI